MDVGDVTVETFAGREGERFAVELPDGTLDLTLAEVTRPPESWGRMEGREPFSIVLHGPLDRVLAQQVWSVDHAELGRLAIFLVPLGPEGEAMRYEAVFN